MSQHQDQQQMTGFISRGETLPKYYECGICSCYHPAEWDDDCRDDANRFALDQLDAKHGSFGWEEVPMPGNEDGDRW